MRRFVLDASVSLAWFLDSPVPALAIRVRQSFGSGSRAVVPALWRLEMANGFATAERRGTLTPSSANRCLSDVERLMASVLDDATYTISPRQAFLVARTFRLTAYDASYLETARTEYLPLATLDHALAQAAMKAGVPLFS